MLSSSLPFLLALASDETSFASVMPEGPCVDMSLSGVPVGDVVSTFETHVTLEAYAAFLAGEASPLPFGIDADVSTLL